jgi:hypothetical protein
MEGALESSQRAVWGHILSESSIQHVYSNVATVLMKKSLFIPRNHDAANEVQWLKKGPILPGRCEVSRIVWTKTCFAALQWKCVCGHEGIRSDAVNCRQQYSTSGLGQDLPGKLGCM